MGKYFIQMAPSGVLLHKSIVYLSLSKKRAHVEDRRTNLRMPIKVDNSSRIPLGISSSSRMTVRVRHSSRIPVKLDSSSPTTVRICYFSRILVHVWLGNKNFHCVSRCAKPTVTPAGLWELGFRPWRQYHRLYQP